MKPTSLVVLGATGSIGKSLFKVFEQHRDRIVIDGLVAHQNRKGLYEMGKAMGARWVALTDEAQGALLQREVNECHGPRVLSGEAAMMEAIGDSPATDLLAAMSGFAGLTPTLCGLARGMRVLLANKETLVAAGDLVRQVARQSGGSLVPVDSEHSAIFQCLASDQPLRRIVLTCSGGPFRGRSQRELADITIFEALTHPNWVMGRKITIDSATLMNKGLELIEAHHLFDAPYDRIDVVVHPESVVHSMVEFVDGATMAQMGVPDMQVPIAVALAWPERLPLHVPGVTWPGTTLHFEEPDLETFQCLALARRAGEEGGVYPTVLNAANEVAVAAFLAGQVGFLDIAHIVEESLSRVSENLTVNTVEDVLRIDQWGRQIASQSIEKVRSRR